jgi:hypothetical protein
MKKGFWMILMVMVLALSIGLTGCSAGSAEAEVEPDVEDEAAEEVFPNIDIRSLNLGGGGAGGSWYLICAQLSEKLKETMPDVNVSVIEGGAISNVRLTNEGVDLDVGVASYPNVLDALGTANAFAEDNIDNVGVIMNFAKDYVQFTVKADSGIESIADLSDKVVLPGPNGWGIEVLTRDVLGLYDLDYDTIKANGGGVSFVSWGEAPSLIKDGHADMVAFKGAFPMAKVMEIEATNDAKILSLGEDKLDDYIAGHSGYAKGVIPAGTYKGQAEDALTLSHTSVLFANGDLSEDVVYVLTKTLYENADYLSQIEGVSINENPVEGVDPAVIHPGALRYYEEQGIL